MLTECADRKKLGHIKKMLFVGTATALALLITVSLIFKGGEEIPTASGNISTVPTVIVDAGHGGFDGGAVSLDGTKESELNLKVALKTSTVLKILGIKPILTRDGDTALNTVNGTLREMKVSDMNNRLDLMKKTQNAVFLSIHMNKYSSSSPHGAQMFYSPYGDSKELAEILQTSVKNITDQDNKRTIKAATKDIFLLFNAPLPSVIAECGFISNKDDLAKLKSNEGQNGIALALSLGVAEYFAKTEKSD